MEDVSGTAGPQPSAFVRLSSGPCVGLSRASKKNF
jgi:hypothetical protein